MPQRWFPRGRGMAQAWVFMADWREGRFNAWLDVQSSRNPALLQGGLPLAIK